MSDRRPSELAEFLSVRRARLTPRDAGLEGQAPRRRVPGLRREELARLAGVSTDYYTRLEQGRHHNVSDAVLDAVARALRLGVGRRAPASGGGRGGGGNPLRAGAPAPPRAPPPAAPAPAGPGRGAPRAGS